MKKRLGLLIIGLAMAMLSTGCAKVGVEQDLTQVESSGQVNTGCIYNTAFEKYAEDEELGIIINEPTQEELGKITQLDTYKHVENSEKMLIIPKYKGSHVIIRKVEFDDNGIAVKETVYSQEQTEDNYGLLLETVRPEGIPELMLTITTDEKSIDYLVAYNGKEGTQPIEYLILEADETIKENEEIKVIEPMLEGDYLEGYNLLDQREVDIDYDEVMESLEVYSTAGYDENGMLLMDDGQEWALIVRKGDQIYPVFERDYIQLGKLEYKTYTEYLEEDIFHLLISKVQGAGIIMYDCYYDQAQDAFVSEIVYQTTGNIGIGEQYK